MKVMQRSIMKVIPGKMAEAMELEKKEMAIWSRLGTVPIVTRYRPFAGAGDFLHTLVYQHEWESLAAMEAAYEKAMTEPEMQAISSQWETVLENYQNEFYMPMP